MKNAAPFGYVWCFSFMGELGLCKFLEKKTIWGDVPSPSQYFKAIHVKVTHHCWWSPVTHSYKEIQGEFALSCHLVPFLSWGKYDRIGPLEEPTTKERCESIHSICRNSGWESEWCEVIGSFWDGSQRSQSLVFMSLESEQDSETCF